MDHGHDAHEPRRRPQGRLRVRAVISASTIFVYLISIVTAVADEAPDWILLIVTAGSTGAVDVVVSADIAVTPEPDYPAAVVLAVSEPRTRPWTYVAPISSGSIRVTSTRNLGGIDVDTNVEAGGIAGYSLGFRGTYAELKEEESVVVALGAAGSSVTIARGLCPGCLTSLIFRLRSCRTRR